MVSEIERIAQALVAVVDELPGIADLLRTQIRRLQAQASELGDIANKTGDLHARHAALQLHAAAQACGRACDRAVEAHRKGRQWAAEKVGGTGGPGGGIVRGSTGSRVSERISAPPPLLVEPERDDGSVGQKHSGPPPWLKRVREGKQWHVDRQVELDQRGGVSEMYVDQDGGGYNVVDHYNLAERRILSMKHTQLARIGLGTALEYVREASRKYSPGTRIANVPSTPEALRGLKLQGRLFLYVPAQKDPVPQEVLDLAKKLRVQIVDDTGRMYP